MLHTEKQLRKILRNVKFLLEQAKFVVSMKGEPVEIGQFREFFVGYPIFGMVVDEVWKGVYWVVPFTIDVEFAHRSAPFVALEEKLTLLAGFPFWVYMTRDFLERYSVVVEKFSEEEVKRILEWAEDLRLEELEPLQEKYVRVLMRWFATLNTETLLEEAEKIEEEV